MAFNKFETLTNQQMQIVAEGIVQRFIWSYTEDSCYEYRTKNTCPKLMQDSLIKTRLNLCNILGSVPDAMFLPKTERKMTEEITEWHLLRIQDSLYTNWVPWALQNRNLFIPLWTKSRAVQFWGMVDQAAIKKNLDYKARQRLFAEIGSAIMHYKQSLTLLDDASASDRKKVFDLSARISPRYRAYELQEDLWKKRRTDLTVANQQLRNKLVSIGVKVPKTCNDFYDYEFTRYDRTYDYLFALTRWAARHDGGTLTESAISGFKNTTIDALVKDGKGLAGITYGSLNNYRIIN